jgi:16S rRNA (uracil1498-N3)-methyltransferase
MRQYIASDFPDSQGLLRITGKDYRYFHKILRVKSGDMIQVRLPDQVLQNMTVCTPNKYGKDIILQVCTEHSECGKSLTRGTSASEISATVAKPEYWLFQFIARPQKMDIIIRQATECGVHLIVPVIGEYTQSGNIAGTVRSGRIERIIHEARQQSGSSVETKVVEPVNIHDAVLLWQQHTEDADMKSHAAFVLYERETDRKTFTELIESLTDIRTAALAVGCEGGISPSEIEYLMSAGFIPVHLMTNILRCETAALYGLAVLQTAVKEK